MSVKFSTYAINKDVKQNRDQFVMETQSLNNENWQVLGIKIPKSEVVFFSQIIILYVVIIACIVNLSISHPLSELWVGLLSSSIGFLLPNPTIKDRRVLLNNG